MEIINITDQIIEVNVTEAVVNVVTQTGAYPLPSNVFSVFGRVGNIVGEAGDYTTSIVAEGTNLYYTQARFDNAFGGKTTTDLTEGTNLYYTDARSRSAISENITGLEYSSASGIFSLASGYVIPTEASLDAKVPYTGATGDVNLNSHKLLTAQVKATSSAGLSINSNGGTQIANLGAGGGANMTLYGGLSGTSASFSSSVTGNTIVKSGGTSVQFLKADGSVDSTTYTSQSRSINTTAPLTGGGDLSADRTLSMPAATTSANGYLTSTDWNTFNNKENFLASGTTAQYYRGDKTFQTLDTLAVPENTNLYYTAARFNTAFSGKTTTDLAEGTNLYFTTARAQAAISGTAPISVASGVVSISQATGSSSGYLSSTDWNTFNNKQAALNGTGFVKISGTTISYDNSTYLTTIEGITAGGELSGTYASPSLVNSAVTGKILSGVNITGGTISDTDSILTAFGKLQNQVNGLIGGSIYKGTWNASTNTPTLASGVGTKGNYYIVSVAGSTNIDGITDWNVGDWIIYDGTAWQQVDNTDAVVSVNGETGAVSLTTSNIAEGTNLYFTNARSIASTLTGYTSGAGTISSSDTILSAIQKLNGNVSGLVTGVSSVFGRTGAVTAQSGDYTTTQVTEGTNLYYTEGRVSANTDVAANTAARHAAVTLGTANGLSLSTQQLSLGLASGSATGALSSTDWNTFNGKQAALNGTGFVKISGTTISYDNSTYLTTSAASSTYLPLAGGTLTGPLGGTTGTFTGNFTTNGIFIGRTTNGQAFGVGNGVDSDLGIFVQTGNIAFSNTGTASGFSFALGGSTRFSIASTGAATFSSSVTAGGYFYANSTSPNSSGFIPQLGGSGKGWFATAGTTGDLLNEAATGDIIIRSQLGKILLGTYQSGGSDAFAALTIANNRNVGIGTSSPANALVISTGAGSGGNRVQLLPGTDYSFFQIDHSGGTTYIGTDNSTGSVFGQGNYSMNIYNSYAGDINFFTSSAIRMKIVNDGILLIGKTSAGIDNGDGIRIDQNGNIFSSVVSGEASYYLRDITNAAYRFYVTAAGQIYATNTSISGISDQRLKENIKDLDVGLDAIMALRPRKYDWKPESGNSGKNVRGFIAQEVEAIFPDLIDEWKSEGKITYKSLRQDFIPMLVKAIQEQQAQIEELKAKM
jgi:hypothetical protein